MKRKEQPWSPYTLRFSSFHLVIIPCTNRSPPICGSLEHLAYSLPEDVFPATATLLVPSPLIVMEMDSAIASLEWQGRSVTAVHMAFTTLKKEAVLVCKCFPPKHRLIRLIDCLFIYLFITKILVWLILDCLTNFPDRENVLTWTTLYIIHLTRIVIDRNERPKQSLLFYGQFIANLQHSEGTGMSFTPCSKCQKNSMKFL